MGAALHRALAEGAGADGGRQRRAATTGTPQGGVISPLLANLFLHYAFDMWMARTYPTFRSSDTRTTSSVTVRAPRRRGSYGARLLIALRPASWCCIRRRRRSSTVRMRTGVAISEPIVRLSRVLIPSKEDAMARRHPHARFPARSSTESADVHQPDDPAFSYFTITATSPCRIWLRCTIRTLKAGSTTTATSIGRIASDPQEDRCLCHPLGAPEVQAVESQNQRSARLV